MADQVDQKEVELQPMKAEASEPAQYPPPTMYPEVTVEVQPSQPAPTQAQEVHPLPLFGSKSQHLTCLYCRHAIATKTSRSLGLLGWVFAMVLFLICLGTCLPLCCIPCCIPACYDTKHSCPNCGALLGKSGLLPEIDNST